MSLNLLCFGVFAAAEQILNFINLGNGLADIFVFDFVLLLNLAVKFTANFIF